MTQLANQLALFTYQPSPKSEAAIDSFKIAICKAKHEEAKIEIGKKRYYYHRMLKGKFVIDADNRTIAIPYHSLNEVPLGDRYYVAKLIGLGYNAQMLLL